MLRVCEGDGNTGVGYGGVRNWVVHMVLYSAGDVLEMSVVVVCLSKPMEGMG